LDYTLRTVYVSRLTGKIGRLQLTFPSAAIRPKGERIRARR